MVVPFHPTLSSNIILLGKNFNGSLKWSGNKNNERILLLWFQMPKFSTRLLSNAFYNSRLIPGV